MSNTKELVLQSSVQLGSMELATPRDVVVTATAVAKELANIIDSKRLYVTMKNGKYVKVEGWATLGSMLGITPKERSVVTFVEGEGPERVHQFEAYIDLVRNSDGVVIGGASAICRTDEVLKRKDGGSYKRWGGMDLNAPRSMAITRATSKALRIALAWIMVLGGYKPTPAEEMEGVIDAEFSEPAKPVAAQQTAPAQASAPGSPKSASDWTAFYTYADSLMDHESAVKISEEFRARGEGAVEAFEHVRANFG
ncbi:MAG: hypothetical protein KF698_08410 [Anaerolineales bacterium]|nr:hypothetical protein [Anaerolineales bacterium]